MPRWLERLRRIAAGWLRLPGTLRTQGDVLAGLSLSLAHLDNRLHVRVDALQRAHARQLEDLAVRLSEIEVRLAAMEGLPNPEAARADPESAPVAHGPGAAELAALHDQLAFLARNVAGLRQTASAGYADLGHLVRASAELLEISRRRAVAQPPETVVGQGTPGHTALRTAGLLARALRAHERGGEEADRAPLPGPCSIKAEQAWLEALNPALFPVWLKLSHNAEREYARGAPGSCSGWDHEQALLFRDYVDVHAKAPILDVGCGPGADPVYLAGRDPATLAAIEPLQLRAAPRFQVVQGFCEHLPWPDGSFGTVVAATSLDHVLSLDRSLAEIRRVLVPGGRFLVWLGSIPGALPYDETSAQPVDDYHLFQFDRAWCEPLFSRDFRICDVTVFPVAGFDHVFYLLQPGGPSR